MTHLVGSISHLKNTAQDMAAQSRREPRQTLFGRRCCPRKHRVESVAGEKTDKHTSLGSFNQWANRRALEYKWSPVYSAQERNVNVGFVIKYSNGLVSRARRWHDVGVVVVNSFDSNKESRIIKYTQKAHFN